MERFKQAKQVQKVIMDALHAISLHMSLGPVLAEPWHAIYLCSCHASSQQPLRACADECIVKAAEDLAVYNLARP